MPNEILTACTADLADAKHMFALAEQTLDLELNARAIAKYRAICDFLNTFGYSIAQVAS